MLYQITLERFKDEIRVEDLSKTRNTIEVEDLGTNLALYFTPINSSKTYVAVVEKVNLTEVDKINFRPFSKPVKRIMDSTELKNITNALNRIETNLMKPPKETIIEREVIKTE